MTMNESTRIDDDAAVESMAGDADAAGARLALSRRNFLGSAMAGLTVSFVLPDALRMGMAEAAGVGTQVAAWLNVAPDESITLTIGASEMGQGSFAGLAQVMAEDLMVNITRVRMVVGRPTLASPAPVGSAINTVGSSVTRNNFWRLRDAAATARELLVNAAMQRQGDATRASYRVADGVITHLPTATKHTYGSVATLAATLPVPATAPLVPDSEFRYIGRSLPRGDIPLKVTGAAKYGIDVRLPNMVYAVIKHCPTLGGRLASVPATPAGMVAVVPTRIAAGTGRGLEAAGNVNAVAVVGTNTWDAWQAAKALRVSWTLPANASLLSDAEFLRQARELGVSAPPYVAGGANPPGTAYTVERSATDADVAINASPRVLDATYVLPYVAHACMEVLNCTVDFVPGVKCEVYAPTQSARSVLALVTSLNGLAEAQVTIHTTYLGGGLGRKAETDFVSQAVQVGMALQRPVKLMWPREEDFTHDQYRPMGLMHVRAGLAANGRVQGWHYRNVSPSILAQRGVVLGPTGDSQGIEGAAHLPYDFGARITEYVTHPSPVPVGFWRSVGASLNTFGVECMIDELAVAAGQDPYLFRRGLLTDSRWLAVLDAAAELGNWSAPLAAGRGRGIAIGTAFNSIVAEVVEVSAVTATSLKVNSVAVAIDCYLPVNPASIDAQLVGGVVHGMNAALFGQQRFVAGAAQAKNFRNNRMIRASEMPVVRTRILPKPTVADRAQPIGGVGELGVPTFAPALMNAYYSATKQRVRTLPLFPTATMGGL